MVLEALGALLSKTKELGLIEGVEVSTMESLSRIYNSQMALFCLAPRIGKRLPL